MGLETQKNMPPIPPPDYFTKKEKSQNEPSTLTKVMNFPEKLVGKFKALFYR